MFGTSTWGIGPIVSKLLLLPSQRQRSGYLASTGERHYGLRHSWRCSRLQLGRQINQNAAMELRAHAVDKVYQTVYGSVSANVLIKALLLLVESILIVDLFFFVEMKQLLL